MENFLRSKRAAMLAEGAVANPDVLLMSDTPLPALEFPH